MENSNNLSKLLKFESTVRPPLLVPQSVIQCVDTFKAESFPHSIVELKEFSEPTDGNGFHQRTYSGSLLTEEVPSWLQELLDEPETPIRRSHRRSSSDSFAYLQTAYGELKGKEHKVKQATSRSSDSSCNINHHSDQSRVSNKDPVSFDDSDATQSEMTEKKNPEEAEGSSPPHNLIHANLSASRTDSKRSKRHSAQQSRARKLQYIAEMERYVQALQAEGSEVSAELEFLDQQNIILGMENRALKQRLDSLSQEHFIKCLEQEILEREITRLRNLYQQQQHKEQKKHYALSRHKNQDLDSSFSKLSLKNKEADLQKTRELPFKTRDVHSWKQH